MTNVPPMPVQGTLLSLVGPASAWAWASGIGTVAIWGLIIGLTPVAVRRLPKDTFVNDAYYLARKRRAGESRLLYFLKRAARNLAGAGLVLLGSVGLQGVLVIMLGLAMMDIPGKAPAVRRLARIGFVWRLMAGIRERAGLEAFDAP